ncbi:hypothetical protein TNCV_2286921 [Trichonephila clavipes]|nr:hypothetical protein TNCV_2286921 [Trichonephila clavipes]
MIYGRVGSEESGENYHTLSLILAGDFNVNIAFEDGRNSCSMVHFSQELFNRRRGIYHEVVQIRDNDHGHINEAYVRNMDSRPPVSGSYVV